MTFNDLNLHPTVLKAVLDQGYDVPTPIQEQAIPLVLAGGDLLGCAQTGTGKTAAFALPILQNLSQNRPPIAARQGARRQIRCLVLAPTRELALQIHESFCAYGRYTGMRSTYVFGGVSQNPQVKALQQGVDILVATPGRLLDLIGQNFINLRFVEVFVLDEADRMLDMGFINDIKKVVAQLPKMRQTLLFSATLQPEIRNLAAGMLRDPSTVSVAPPASTVDRIEQSIHFVEKAEKINLLLRLLENADVERALVFTRTKHGADKVVRKLTQAGIMAAAIHGNKSQNNRQGALDDFKEGRTRVLIATDIASRGLDIDHVSHVFNMDLPMEPEAYVHRIGRTARAGHDGIAIAFCSSEEKSLLTQIERMIGKRIPAAGEGHRNLSERQSPRFKERLDTDAGIQRQQRDGTPATDGTRNGAPDSDGLATGSRMKGERFGGVRVTMESIGQKLHPGAHMARLRDPDPNAPERRSSGRTGNARPVSQRYQPRSRGQR